MSEMPQLPKALQKALASQMPAGNIPILGQTTQEKKGCILQNPQTGEIMFKWNMKSKKYWIVQDMVRLCCNLADSLEKAEREGSEVDEPEGSRYVQFSDTLINDIVKALRDGKQPEKSEEKPKELKEDEG